MRISITYFVESHNFLKDATVPDFRVEILDAVNERQME